MEGEWDRGVCGVVVHLPVVTSMRIYTQASVNCHNKTSAFMSVTSSGAIAGQLSWLLSRSKCNVSICCIRAIIAIANNKACRFQSGSVKKKNPNSAVFIIYFFII